MGDEILTTRDVAGYLKVTEKTVYGLAQKRRIPGFKVGGQWRFRRQDIDAWIGTQTADAVGGGKASGAPGAGGPAGGRRRGRERKEL